MLQFWKNNIAIVFVVFFYGCLPGNESDKPPIHLNPNMDSQEKYKSYSESKFFKDKRTMRLPVKHTVKREFDNNHKMILSSNYSIQKSQGKNVDGSFIKNLTELNLYKKDSLSEFLKLGRTKYNIYCSVCHGLTADGKGIVALKGYDGVTNLLELEKNIADGKIFDVISNGYNNGNMPAYNYLLTIKERWAIVAYIKLLQHNK